MLIAHVHFTVVASDRDKALNTLLGEVQSVRSMKGCLSFMPFADPTNDTGLGVLHEWENKEDFAAYATSAEFDAIGQIFRPMMTAAPVSNRFDATPHEAVN